MLPLPKPAPRTWIIPLREAEVAAAAFDALPTLVLADDVSQLLAEIVQNVTVGESDDTPTGARRHALWLMAIIALRALRSAMHILTVGYEDQVAGYTRLIDELHNRAQQVRNDQSGEHARRWLAGRPVGKGAKIGEQGLWEFLSGPVHANVRAALDWLAISQDDGSTKVLLGPERRPDLANGALVFMASEGRDIANLLALEAGLTPGLSELDWRIKQARAVYNLEPA